MKKAVKRYTYYFHIGNTRGTSGVWVYGTEIQTVSCPDYGF